MEKVNGFTTNQSSVVDIGAKIEIEVNGELQAWEIVGAGESDIPNGRISLLAPLIQCILGAKKGDKIKCRIMDNDAIIVINNVSLVAKIDESF